MFNRIVKIFELIKIILQILIYKKRVFIIGVPYHGNLGDQAIIIAENQYIKDILKNKKVIEIESSITNKFIKIFKKLIKKDDIIFMHGGGFLGNLWPVEEEMFRKTISSFKDNNIIVLPQTIFFTNDELGEKELNVSKKIYNNHKKLYISCREEYTLNFSKKEFKCKLLLVPDIVLYLEDYILNKNRKDVLFCLRKDSEKVNHNYSGLTSYINKLQYKIDLTDTVILKRLYKINRKKFVFEKLKQFSKYKLVVTDRLHGMIFAYLTNTPCIVFENKSYKIKGVYEWIKGCNFIKLVNDESDVNEICKNLLSIKDIKKEEIKDKFAPLTNSILEINNEVLINE